MPNQTGIDAECQTGNQTDLTKILKVSLGAIKLEMIIEPHSLRDCTLIFPKTFNATDHVKIWAEMTGLEITPINDRTFRIISMTGLSGIVRIQITGRLRDRMLPRVLSWLMEEFPETFLKEYMEVDVQCRPWATSIIHSLEHVNAKLDHLAEESIIAINVNDTLKAFNLDFCDKKLAKSLRLQRKERQKQLPKQQQKRSHDKTIDPPEMSEQQIKKLKINQSGCVDSDRDLDLSDAMSILDIPSSDREGDVFDLPRPASMPSKHFPITPNPTSVQSQLGSQHSLLSSADGVAIQTSKSPSKVAEQKFGSCNSIMDSSSHQGCPKQVPGHSDASLLVTSSNT